MSAARRDDPTLFKGTAWYYSRFRPTYPPALLTVLRDHPSSATRHTSRAPASRASRCIRSPSTFAGPSTRSSGISTRLRSAAGAARRSRRSLRARSAQRRARRRTIRRPARRTAGVLRPDGPETLTQRTVQPATSADFPRWRRYISSTQRNAGRCASESRYSCIDRGGAPVTRYSSSGGTTIGLNSAAAVRSATLKLLPTR